MSKSWARAVVVFAVFAMLGSVSWLTTPVGANTITTPGPLTEVTTSPTLHCTVRYLGDTHSEFFGDTACGTFVVVGTELFSPGVIPAGSAIGTATQFVPISQVGPTGAGTSANPYRTVTVVSLPGTPLTLTQTDVYIAGQQSYTTTVQIANSSATPVAATVYRAGDCFLENSDFGTGAVGSGSVACVSTSGRIEQLVPITPGSHYMEALYNQIWAQIGIHGPMPDTLSMRRAHRQRDWPQLGCDRSRLRESRSLVGALVRQRIGQLRCRPRRTSRRLGNPGIDTNGDGVPEVNLPAMGATADHKDVFVEADWMKNDGFCFLWFCWEREASRRMTPR